MSDEERGRREESEKIEKGSVNRTLSLDISIPRVLERDAVMCVDCDLNGIQHHARAHNHHVEETGEAEVRSELETEVQKPLSFFQRGLYGISSAGWAGLATLVFALDWITGHVLDGLLLDFIYVTAGIVAFLEFRAAWRGYARGAMTYRDVNTRVKEHFFAYKRWLSTQLRLNK